MRKQIYQNQIWAQHYPQVTRFKVLLSELDEETREEDRRGLIGIDWEGRGGDVDCPQDYWEKADCEVNGKQRWHLTELSARKAERGEKAARED